MNDCEWNTDGPPWACVQCGYKYPIPSEKPPHRNCGKARERMIAEIDRLMAESPTPETDVEINRVAERLMCWEFRQRKRGGCKKGKRER